MNFINNKMNLDLIKLNIKFVKIDIISVGFYRVAKDGEIV